MQNVLSGKCSRESLSHSISHEAHYFQLNIVITIFPCFFFNVIIYLREGAASLEKYSVGRFGEVSTRDGCADSVLPLLPVPCQHPQRALIFRAAWTFSAQSLSDAAVTVPSPVTDQSTGALTCLGSRSRDAWPSSSTPHGTPLATHVTGQSSPRGRLPLSFSLLLITTQGAVSTHGHCWRTSPPLRICFWKQLKLTQWDWKQKGHLFMLKA